MSPSGQPSLPAYTWPVSLNAFWLALLSLAWGTASFVVTVVVLASAGNLVGILIALLRRRWAIAKWYSLALVMVLCLGVIAMYFVEIPLYQDE